MFRYGETNVLFPFGYGLSYTRFNYSDLNAPASVPTCSSINISVSVTNVGKIPGHEVVQVYVIFENAPMETPNIQLAAFQKVYLEPGEKMTVTLTVAAQQTAVLNASDYVPSGGGHGPRPPPGPPAPCTNQCCKALPGVLIEGGQDMVKASDANDCCAACAARSSCNGFSFSTKGCWLKTHVTSTTNESDHTSGIVTKRTGCNSASAAPTPPSPPPPVWTPQWLSVPLQVHFHVGGQQPNQPTSIPSNILSSEVAMTGAVQPLEGCSEDNLYPRLVAPVLPANGI